MRLLFLILLSYSCVTLCQAESLPNSIVMTEDSVYADSMVTAAVPDSMVTEAVPDSMVNEVIADSMITNAIADSGSKAEPGEVYRNYKFTARKLIAPGVLLAVGAAAIPFHDKLGGWGTHKQFRMDDYIQYVPVAGFLFTGFTGIKHKHNFLQRIQIAATAYILEAALVNAIKYSVREQRPGNGSFNSFPSGHTATVMTGAELCRLEYGWKVGLGAYAIGLVTAGLRVYNRRHWCNDVVAGAGIGILAANAAYWLYPLEQRLFAKLRKKKPTPTSSHVFLVPSYEPTTNAAALHLTLSL